MTSAPTHFRRAVATPVLALVLAVLAGCSTTLSGRAVSIYHDPYTVAGLPATDGPSGARPGVPDARLPITGGTSDPVDRLAANALSDIADYWKTQYPKTFHRQFHPVEKFESWDSRRAGDLTFCGDPTEHLVNAGYCREDDAMGWDRGTLMPTVERAFGPLAVVVILAHEYGHAVQMRSRSVAASAPTIVLEQQADCYAGAFMRSVAEGGSRHFTMNTSDGLSRVLAAMISTRDNEHTTMASAHGSAFDRVTAFQFGFTSGPDRCTRIDADDIDQRQDDLPQPFTVTGRDGRELPVDAKSLDAVMASLQQVFTLRDRPKLDLRGIDSHCVDAQSTSPASYCPATNTVSVDLPALAARGAVTDRADEFPTHVQGDFSAFLLVASRFAIAVQRQGGAAITGAEAAVRGACLSGAWAGATATSPDGLQLSPGDLDEAVSELLSDGLAAADVDGRSVPSGFSRVDAFRAGVLGGRTLCEHRYR
ncbi:metallopeptidase [Rhodococcus sp. D2-41]|uniref:Metallopeptidase n=1 Tax=Speluncibacter jeojiensis TaxID=2710754 RepID=A0A9X4RJF2_9ACTN|nr:metallopeptidase [Rhodococcus sp. D2-41]MDG3012803.1 metallopeptidase [Rhodococcus sp. D2-41]MDG3017121.1 metallopeptidase [Corynebacteriales bacterium D3-21]